MKRKYLALGTYYSIEDLKRANENAGQHYFEPGTMRFFKSRVCAEVLPVATGWLFMTSEQGPNMPRLYSIRHMDVYGNADTVGEFQAYSTRSKALTAMKRMVKVMAAEQQLAREAM